MFQPRKCGSIIMKKNGHEIKTEILHWQQWNRWDQRERMKRISLDKADENGTWINDEEKKTTTSTALAVSRFHLDGASHLEERRDRARRLELAVAATMRGHKPDKSRHSPPILIAVLRYWSKHLGYAGNQNTITQLSWLDTIVFLQAIIQCKHNSLGACSHIRRHVCVYVALSVRICGFSWQVHGQVEAPHVCV